MPDVQGPGGVGGDEFDAKAVTLKLGTSAVGAPRFEDADDNPDFCGLVDSSSDEDIPDVPLAIIKQKTGGKRRLGAQRETETGVRSLASSDPSASPGIIVFARHGAHRWVGMTTSTGLYVPNGLT